jgi:fumarate reductase flavoprotein subunit
VLFRSGPRVWHFIKDLSAKGLIRPLYEKIKTVENIRVLMDTPVTSIIREKGRVTGLTAKDKDGNPIRVKAKAVIVASGGYQNNPEWLAKYCKAGRYLTAFVPSKQFGEPIQMAWDAGAAKDGMGILQAVPFVPGERDQASQLLHAGMQPYLWVNKKGERFCDESINWRFPLICNALAAQPEATAYCIYDHKTKENFKTKGIQYSIGEYLKPSMVLDRVDAELEDGIKEGKVWRAASLRELAQKLSIDPAAFKATIDEYNSCCDQNRDFIFGKDRRYFQRIETPEFYAVQLKIHILITEGGIKINHRMEAIDNEYNVIPGLFAVGCCVAGLVGETYNLDTTGGSIGFACNSGRMAGESILKLLKK